MLDKVLDDISADQRRAGEIVRPPASAEAIAAAADAVSRELQAVMPSAYAEFLRRQDGVDYNGVVFYGATASPDHPEGGFWQGIVAANRLWRAGGGNGDLLVLGDSDMDIYAVPAAGGPPGKFDRVTGERLETYADVASMIATVLRQRL